MQISRIFIAAVLAVCATGALAAPESVKPSAGGKQTKKSVFSGNEARIASYNVVNTDCTSGPLVDYRVVVKPAKGTVRLEPETIPINRSQESNRAHCNGKSVDALSLYYKAPEGFTGTDRVAIDIDWRNGEVDRYDYVISIR